jgi:hypothetical protein
MRQIDRQKDKEPTGQLNGRRTKTDTEQGERDTRANRQTDRQRLTGSQPYRKTDSQTGRKAYRQTDRQTSKYTYRNTDRRTDRRIDMQTSSADRKADRQTDLTNYTERHKDIQNAQTDRQRLIERQPDRQEGKQINRQTVCT